MARPRRRLRTRRAGAAPSDAPLSTHDARDLGRNPTRVEGLTLPPPITDPEVAMPYAVDFADVSTVGLESSPVADALAGLRANEARYFKNKYSHAFTVEPASDAVSTVDWVSRILKEERGIVISSRPLEATAFQV